MRVRLLGPVRAFDGDREIDLGGPRNRALVARLALDAGRAVPVAVLVDDLWGEDLPADAAGALQSVVSRTRRRLPDGALRSTAAGYLLDADVDADEFARRLAAGNADDALALWDGPALADVRDVPFAAAHAASLEEARLTATEQRLRRAEPTAAVAVELAALVRDHPYRDGLWETYLRALVATGRSADALVAYQGLRERLADELGVDPSAALQALHADILRGTVNGAATARASVAPGGTAAAPAAGSSAAPSAGSSRDSLDRTSDRTSDRLPAALTSFVGREDAVAALGAALQEHRLVTVLGPGGAGKTRLAIEAARRHADRYADVWLVELAAVTSQDDVVPAVLTAMGLLEVSVLERAVTPPPPRDLRLRLLDGARDVGGLLVLDNCEHLVDAVAAVAGDLLAASPRLRVLATSREPLRIIGEATQPLGPLTVPEGDATLERARACSAVRLFVERAVAADPHFVLDEATLPAVREICARLDGQPLALELAAARLRTMTAADVAARLSDRFRLLTGGSRTALPRHRTLRAVVEWSWDLLAERERDLAERVAVFPGGVRPEGAAAVLAAAGGPPPTEDDVRDLLDALVDKSLLEPVRGTGRYRMLETLREYGVERLVERGLAEQVRSAHLDHYLALGGALTEQIRGPGQLAAVEVVEAERGNLTAALRYAIDAGDRARAALLATHLTWFWSIRNQHVEIDTWVAAIRRLPGRADPVAEIACAGLAAAGELVLHKSPDGWRPIVDELLAVWDAHRPDDPLTQVVMATLHHLGLTGDRVLPESDDPWTLAMVRLVQLVLLENEGRMHEQLPLLDEVIAGLRSCGDAWGLATALGARALVEAADGRFAEALATYTEALPLLEALHADEDIAFARMRLLGLRLAAGPPEALPSLRVEVAARLADAERAGDRLGAALARLGLGQVEHAAGDDRAATAHFRRLLDDLAVFDTFGSGQFEAMLRGAYAVAVTGAGYADAGAEQAAEAMRVAVAVRDMPVIAFVGSCAAAVRAAAGDDAGAARLVGAARAVRGRDDRSNRDEQVLRERLRDRLGAERYEALLDEGARLPRDEAVGLLLAEVAAERTA